MKTLDQVVMGVFVGVLLGFLLEATFWSYLGYSPRLGNRMHISGSNTIVRPFVFGPLFGIIIGVLLGLFHRKLVLNKFLSYLTLGCAFGVVAGILAGAIFYPGIMMGIYPLPEVDPKDVKAFALQPELVRNGFRKIGMKWGIYIGAGLGTIAGIAMYYRSQNKTPALSSAEVQSSELEERS